MINNEILVPLAISASIYLVAILINKNLSLSKKISNKFIKRKNIVSFFFLSMILIVTIDLLFYMSSKNLTDFSKLLANGFRLGIFISSLNIVFDIIKLNDIRKATK
ncbi:hypothetical protein [Clostridium sp. YIM B02506]|uniref:hypothetical protein n=1 Tax=Clostridium sp. YIM B02506 TaxID=2910680 RepID=UPI001EEE9555|nr:hypothetical protein [Clostridium sp. YIM B02506]